MNLTGSSKGLSTEVSYIVVAIVLGLSVVTAVGLYTASAGDTGGDAGGDVYFDAVATQSTSQLESPWASGNDADTINQVHFTDEDQTSAGNATFNVANGTTVDDTRTSYINVEVSGDEPAPMTLEAEFDNTGAFDQDNTNLDNVRLRDYDETDTVSSFDALSLQQEESVRAAGVEDGDYVLQVDFEFQSVSADGSTGIRDTIMTLTGNLESPEAPDDEPTEFEDFSYDTLTE